MFLILVILFPVMIELAIYVQYRREKAYDIEEQDLPEIEVESIGESHRKEVSEEPSSMQNPHV